MSDPFLVEYEEAGRQCRWYEQLTRTALTVYTAMITAISALLFSTKVSPAGGLMISLVGCIVSLVFLSTSIRNMKYYSCYMKRLNVLESHYGMYLYRGGKDVYESTNLLTNKTVFSFLYAVGIISFLASAVYFAALSKLFSFVLP